MNKNILSVPIASILIFAAFFAAGGHYDLHVAEQMYSPADIMSVLLAIAGPFPFFACFNFFDGVLCRQAALSGVDGKKKTLLKIICTYLACSTGYLGASTLLSENCLGIFFPDAADSIPLKALFCAAVMLPVFIWGYRTKTDEYSPLLVRRLISLLILMTVSFGVTVFSKTLVFRPRYRLLLNGFDGIYYIPWYQSSVGSNPMPKLAASGEYHSFPSGHSIIAASCMYIFPAFAWIFPVWKDKERLLALIGMFFGIAVMLSRMVLGAHYLSDVSCGGMIAAVFMLIDFCVQEINEKRFERQG